MEVYDTTGVEGLCWPTQPTQVTKKALGSGKTPHCSISWCVFCIDVGMHMLLNDDTAALYRPPLGMCIDVYVHSTLTTIVYRFPPPTVAFFSSVFLHSKDVYISSSWPFRRLRSMGSARISTPGPTRRAPEVAR